MRSAARPNTRYRLSFSVGGLFVREALVAAPLYLRTPDWTAVRAAINVDNLLQARTVSSARRLASELVQRLQELTVDEVELVVDGTLSERSHLMWTAACRRYSLLGEFAEEVVRERLLLLAPTLSAEHFDAFVRAKTVWHEELANAAASTLQRLRSNTFLMLREAELLSDAGEILPAVLSQRVEDALRRRSPSDVRFFPTSTETRGSVR